MNKKEVETELTQRANRSLGKIVSITEVLAFRGANSGRSEGSNGARISISAVLNDLCGYGEYDGYEVKTEAHTFLILIDNGQSCCESWGYFTSEDDINSFVGKALVDVELTDEALNARKVEESGYYDSCGGIQFVNFKCADGTVLQFAVYNAHNGYYGHPIIIAKDENILLHDTL